jgi:hypothetical protein
MAKLKLRNRWRIISKHIFEIIKTIKISIKLKDKIFISFKNIAKECESNDSKNHMI